MLNVRAPYILVLLMAGLQMLGANVALSQSGSCPIKPAHNRIEYAVNLRDVQAKLFKIQQGLDSTFVVVHFGDSHIQLDHFSGQVRHHLQHAFGDCGEGVLFPYSACKSFGPKHLETKMEGGWTCNTVLNNTTEEGLGVTGYVMHTTDSTARMNFKYLLDSAVLAAQPDLRQHLKTVTVWHGKDDWELELDCKDCAGRVVRVPSNSERNIAYTQIYDYPANTPLKLRFKPSANGGQFRFHGISFDTPRRSGIQYHHCGVVGAQFVHFIRNAPLAVSQLAMLQPDLVIFSYGSNEGYIPGFNEGQYDIGIRNVMEAMRKVVPRVNFLFTTPPDTRAGNKTPPNTATINAHLRRLAAENGAALWDLFSIMGGDNSVYYWLSHKLARTDKLHFTRSGYVLMGDLLALAFMESYNQHYDHGPSTESLVQQIAEAAQAHGLQPPFCGPAEIYMTAEQRAAANQPPKKPEPPKKPAEPFKTKSIFYTVERGETLAKIAKRFEETEAQIREWNHLPEGATLKAGQRIVVKRVE